MRFELIDRVVEQADDRLVAVKNVTLAEEYLAEHFPSFPVLPGVLVLETMVQAGRRLVAEVAAESLGPNTPLILEQARNVRYSGMVRPGQALTVEVTLRSVENDAAGQPVAFELAGVGKVGDGSVCQGRFRLSALPHGS